MKKALFRLSFAMLLFASCHHAPTEQIRNEWQKYYQIHQVEGSFVLFDPQENIYSFFNKSQFDRQFSPASTFKICNSLIGLETGVITDEYFVIPWDSIPRQNPGWNTDQNLSEAFRNSTVWYYQELARRVGGERMKLWLDKTGYGNADTTGGIDRFWLAGGLKISPRQQIDFLRRLHDNDLPFSQRSMDITKKIMIEVQTPDDTLRAKTGATMDGDRTLGWYVGWLETKGKVYYFANCIQSGNEDFSTILTARKEIAFQILKDMNLMK
jgi:beta-lactamase class D